MRIDMRGIIGIIFLLTTIVCSAANVTKSWSDGPLLWNDFKGVTMIEGVPSYLKTLLDIEYKQESESGRLKYTVMATASADCDLSFANAEQRTEQRLRYHQLQFDMLELFRRRLQSEINYGMTVDDAANRLKQYKAQYQDKIDEITVSTDNGTRQQRIQDYEYYVKKNLEELALPQAYKITSGDWSYGILLGTGGVFPLANINDAFSSAWSFTAGVGVGYKRLKLNADITYSQPKILNHNIFNVPLQAAIGTYATSLGASFTLGYTIVQTKNFSITPRVGGYLSSYSWNAANYKEDEKEPGKLVIKEKIDLKLNNFNWFAAINFDYHFHSVVGKTPFFITGNREQYISSIRLTPYIGRVEYKHASPQLNGYQVGITISYVGVARSLGLKQ